MWNNWYSDISWKTWTRHNFTMVQVWTAKKNRLLFFLENGGEIKLEFIFSTIFPKTADKKLNSFLHDFSKKNAEKIVLIFFLHRFSKTAEFFLKYFVDYLCANWLSVSLYHFQGSTHYFNLMVCGDQYVCLSISNIYLPLCLSVCL